ncbi:MAG: FimV/HubP family polar landmark protein, partial [Burkholderiales bacterium]
APKAAAKAPAPAAPSPAGASAGAGEYAVQKGDTLFKIAGATKPEGATLEQMLTALYRSNPDAFQGNMNRLKTGKILKVPDAATATAMPQPEALKEVRVQTADWNAYRKKLAEAPADATPGDTKPAAGKITAATPDKAAKEPPKDVVRLSKGEAPAAAGKPAKPMSSRERLRMLEEETTAKEKALAEANDRIAQLEKNIGDMQKLLQLKGQPVPPAAKPDAAKAAPPLAVTKAEPPKPEAKAVPPEPAKPAPADTKAAVTPPPVPDTKAAPPPDAKAVAPVPPAPPVADGKQPAPEAKPVPLEPPKTAPDAPKGAPDTAKAEPAPKPKPKPAPPPPPPPPPNLVDQVLEEPLYLAGGAAALLALLGGGFMALKRRRRAGGDDDRKIAPKLGASAAGAASPLSMQSTVIMPAQSSEPMAMSEADVYIDEADMFMKIGRDAQAEERLKEALEKEPGRQDAQLKLLEIYSVRKDKAGFEKIAQGLQQGTGGSGDNWLRAASLGYALDPTNALYAAGKDTHAAAPLAAGSGGDLDFDLDLDNKSVSETDVLLDTGDRGAADVLDPTKTMIVPPPSRAAAPKPPPPTPAEVSNPLPDFTIDVAHGLGLNTKHPDITIDSLPAEGNPNVTHTNLTAEMGDVANVSSGPNVIDFSLDHLPAANSSEGEATRDGTLILTPENAQKASELTLDVDIGAKPPTETNAPLAPDFKLDLGESTQISPPPGATETVPDLDLGGLSLSMDSPGAAAAAAGDGTKDAHWYDVQTKFDLAKAYQEMGDKDGAREILQEVMKEGDAAQQAEAKQLLDSLA